MRKLLITPTLVLAFLVPITSKADPNLFLNFGIGIGVPAPVFIAPAPVVYPVPNFAVISPDVFFSFGVGVPAPVFIAPAPIVYPVPSFAVISPSVFFSFGIGIAAPVFVAPAPVLVAPSFLSFTTSTVIADPPLVVSHSGPVTVDPATHTDVQLHKVFPGRTEKSTSAFGPFSHVFAHSTPHRNAQSYDGGSFGHLANPSPVNGRSSPRFTHSTPHTMVIATGGTKDKRSIKVNHI